MPKNSDAKAKVREAFLVQEKKDLLPHERGIKLRGLKVKNFKILENLELEFPPPRMKGDPDVIVIGSKNGLGKTSVLEACSLLFLGVRFGETALGIVLRPQNGLDLFDLLIRAGADHAWLQGEFSFNGRSEIMNISLLEGGTTHMSGRSPWSADWYGPASAFEELAQSSSPGGIRSLLGFDSDPFVLPHFIYLHSYRKVREGNIEVGVLQRQKATQPPPLQVASIFKTEVTKLVLGARGAVENLDAADCREKLNQLNELIKEYTNGKIGESVRFGDDNTMQLRIAPRGDGASFPFDGLSSGQKEIIATLFLIWYHTRGQPGIVLVDEPELYLNAEWHRRFIWMLRELAPENQYIIATHSEDVAASVEADRRIMLEP